MSLQIKKKFLAPEIIEYFDNQIDAEESSRVAGDSSLQSQIDSILSNITPETLDSLTEIVSAFQNADEGLIGTISALSGNLDSEVSALESAISAEASARSEADSSLQSAISAEVSDLEVSISLLQSSDASIIQRLQPVENRDLVKKYSLYNDSAAVYSNGAMGVEDPFLITRDGWYFQNSNPADVIGWYFYDRTMSNSGNIQKKDFTAFAVVTLDAVGIDGAKPIFGVYSYPTGSGDAYPGYFHSRWSYQMTTETLNALTAGKKILLYIGQNPDSHPELEHYALELAPSASLGEKLETENIGFCSFNSDTATANKVKWLVESLGVESPSYRQESVLKIRYATKASMESEVSALESADSALSSRVSVLEAEAFAKGSQEIGEELAFIDLDREYETILFMSVGRVAVHEGQDYVRSLEGGVTRITWIGSLANPDGEEKVETGDKVFWCGSY